MIGLHTLTVLKDCGDLDARVAWQQWIYLSQYNNGPVFVDCWLIKNKFVVGLSWH